MVRVVIAGAAGLILGVVLHAYVSAWGSDEPSNSNECVMKRLGDMQNSKAVEALFDLCYWEHGSFYRAEDAQ